MLGIEEVEKVLEIENEIDGKRINQFTEDELLESDKFKDRIKKKKRNSIKKEEVLNIEEKDRLKYLAENFFESEVLLGRIIKKRNNEGSHYMFVQIVMRDDISNKYQLDNKDWQIYCNLKKVNKRLANSLNEDDLIIFKPILNTLGEGIIEVAPKSIKKLIDYKGFLDEQGIDASAVYIEGEVIVEKDKDVKVWASKEFYNGLTFLYKEAIEKLVRKNNDVKNIEIEIDEITQRRNELEKELTDIDEKIQMGEKKIKEQKKILEFWGFEKVLDNKNEVEDRVDSQYSLNEIIDYVRKYLFKYRELRYTENIIRRFILAIKCNELIILSGPSGTGKTSLISGVADAIGAKEKIISVKPSWTDTEDLIGFYNPIENSYISTPFLDAIIEAKRGENKEKLYLICLDEMNIAHVEYYFAEFLSKMELGNGKKVIELYSEEIYKELLEEIISIIKLTSGEDIQVSYDAIKEWCLKNNKIYPEFIMEIKKKIKFIDKYPAKLEIPENIRFVGTINIDHTTKVISPKVIDRSFIIELIQKRDTLEEFEQLLEDKFEKIYLSINDLLLENNEFEKDDIEYLNSVNEDCLKMIMCDYNYRCEKQMINYLKNGNGLNEIYRDDLFNDIVYMKVLPRLNSVFKASDDKARIWDEVKKALNKYGSGDVKEKIERMDKFYKKNNILSFWSVY